MRRSSALGLLVVITAAGAPPARPAPPSAAKPDVQATLLTPATAASGSKATIAVELKLGPGWHVNSHTPSESFLIPTSVTLSSGTARLSPVRYPKPVEKRFGFSEKPLAVYEGTVRFETELEVPAGAAGSVTITGSLSYQACNDQQCFAPATIPLKAGVMTITGPAKSVSN